MKLSLTDCVPPRPSCRQEAVILDDAGGVPYISKVGGIALRIATWSAAG